MPDRLLEVGSLERDGDLERLALSCEIFGELLTSLVENGGRLVRFAVVAEATALLDFDADDFAIASKQFEATEGAVRGALKSQGK